MRLQVKREEEEEDGDLFGDHEGLGGYNSSYAAKRDISQVDSPEESIRPAPSFVVLPLPCFLSLSVVGNVVDCRLARYCRIHHPSTLIPTSTRLMTPPPPPTTPNNTSTPRTS